jgi:hypothetical protein
MKVRLGSGRLLRGVLLAVTLWLATSAPGSAAVTFTRIGTTPGVGGPVYGFTRTANGTLHLVYPTSDSGAQGLTSRSISPAGALGPAVAALPTDWGVSPPGLVALPGGTLEAIFGSALPDTVSNLWGITSTDGGSTWSAPVDVGSGPTLEALAYGAPITAKLTGATPVLTVPQAGNLVIQKGLGPNSPAYLATNTIDGEATDADSAVDAATGEVVASWISLAHPGGPYLQGVEPTVGPPRLVPGQSRPYQAIAGRDTGPGVFAAYTTDAKHVRLLRYGGGTEAVGSLASVPPGALGVATGLDGRIWVMWGSDSGSIALTRSNKAVTRFEPIQHLTDHLLTLDRLSGDGRLGPLDLLVDEIADTTPTLPTGVYHARVLPELSSSVAVVAVKNKLHQVTAHKLTVTVTDASDAVPGAVVIVEGHQQKTNVHGVARLTLAGSSSSRVKLTVTAPTYQTVTKRFML